MSLKFAAVGSLTVLTLSDSRHEPATEPENC